MYNPKGNEQEKDLNLQMHSFFVVKFDYEVGGYQQYSTRMSLENAHNFCLSRRESDPEGNYKVHGELDNF